MVSLVCANGISWHNTNRMEFHCQLLECSTWTPGSGQMTEEIMLLASMQFNWRVSLTFWKVPTEKNRKILYFSLNLSVGQNVSSSCQNLKIPWGFGLGNFSFSSHLSLAWIYTFVFSSKYVWLTWRFVSNLPDHLTAHVSWPADFFFLVMSPYSQISAVNLY